MKTQIHLLTLILIVSMATFLNNSCSSDNNQKNNQVTLGNWVSIDTKSDLAQSSYHYLKTIYKLRAPKHNLAKPIEAKKQVVAGYNILLICTYTDKNQRLKKLKAIVYINPQGKKRITSITENLNGQIFD